MRTPDIETHSGSRHSTQREFDWSQGPCEAVPDPYLVTDLSGRILGANELAGRALGRGPEALRGRRLGAFVSPRDRLSFDAELSTLRKRPQTRVRNWELRLRRESGAEFCACVSAARTDPTARLIAWVVREDSERGRLRAELREASAALILAEERERLSLSQDLHDDLGQLLSLVGMKLGRVRDLADPSVREPLREIEQLVGQIVQRTTSLTFQLHPPVLQTEGLIAAAEWLADDLRRNYGLEVAVKCAGNLEAVEGPTRIILFRSLRELLVNVAKHAGTRCAEVRIAHLGDAVRVSVVDRGKGFGAAEPREGFGLLSVRERLRSLGGQLELRSLAEGGAMATIDVPVPQ